MNHAAISHLFHEDLYQIPLGVVVIVSKPWEAYSDEEKALLSKILGSVKLSPASVQIASESKLSLQKLAAFSSPKILIFGSSLDEIKPYENTQAQGFSVIKADDLSTLDDAKKKNLWLALRTMFGV